MVFYCVLYFKHSIISTDGGEDEGDDYLDSVLFRSKEMAPYVSIDELR